MMFYRPEGIRPSGTVQEFLISERQWPRPCRLARAKTERQLAQTDQDRAFWNQVIKAYHLGGPK